MPEFLPIFTIVLTFLSPPPSAQQDPYNDCIQLITLPDLTLWSFKLTLNFRGAQNPEWESCDLPEGQLLQEIAINNESGKGFRNRIVKFLQHCSESLTKVKKLASMLDVKVKV